MITEQLIRKETGQYDLETLVHLKLSNLHLKHIQGLERCVNIRQLVLSHNDIREITGITHLEALERLDLSFNQIKKIGMTSTAKICMNLS